MRLTAEIGALLVVALAGRCTFLAQALDDKRTTTWKPHHDLQCSTQAFYIVLQSGHQHIVTFLNSGDRALTNAHGNGHLFLSVMRGFAQVLE